MWTNLRLGIRRLITDLNGLYVTGNVVGLLARSPALGRDFMPADDAPDRRTQERLGSTLSED